MALPFKNTWVPFSLATIKGLSVTSMPSPLMKIYSLPVRSAETIWSIPKSRLLAVPLLPAKEPQLTAMGLSEIMDAPISPSRLALVGPLTAITKLSPACKVMGVGLFPAAALLIN